MTVSTWVGAWDADDGLQLCFVDLSLWLHRQTAPLLHLDDLMAEVTLESEPFTLQSLLAQSCHPRWNLCYSWSIGHLAAAAVWHVENDGLLTATEVHYIELAIELHRSTSWGDSIPVGRDYTSLWQRWIKALPAPEGEGAQAKDEWNRLWAIDLCQRQKHKVMFHVWLIGDAHHLLEDLLAIFRRSVYITFSPTF